MNFTPEELERLGLALWGNQWQTPMARALGCSARTVRRWRAGTRTPGNSDWLQIQEWFIDRRVEDVLEIIDDLAAKIGEPPGEIVFNDPDTPLEKIIVDRVREILEPSSASNR